MLRLSCVGRLVRDVKCNDPADGKKACATFSLVVSEYAGSNPDGTPKYESTFLNCKAFDRTATAIARCVKGDVLEVHGNVKVDMWEKEGKFTPSLNCVVREWEKVASASVPVEKKETPTVVDTTTAGDDEDIFN